MSELEDHFDHPCKETCSGWQQGYDKGVKSQESRIKEMEGFKGKRVIDDLTESNKVLLNDFWKQHETIASLRTALEFALGGIKEVKCDCVPDEYGDRVICVQCMIESTVETALAAAFPEGGVDE